MAPKYYRKIIKIRATDSPNVRLGLAQAAQGIEPTDRVLTKGVLRYSEYIKRRKMWDIVRQTIGLDAEFYQGAELLLYPPDWLTGSETAYLTRPRFLPGKSRTWMGVDPGEGSDSTAWAIIDKYGLLYLESFQTPDTSVIAKKTRALMRQYHTQPTDVLFDRGGGGKQIADYLRSVGVLVRSVFFGDGVAQDLEERGMNRKRAFDLAEQKSTFANRRTQMYGELSWLMDPTRFTKQEGPDDPDPDFEPPPQLPLFTYDPKYTELRRQLAPIPKVFDVEGRMVMVPKKKPRESYNGPTIYDLIGCSPDQADALAMATHAMLRPEYAEPFISSTEALGPLDEDPTEKPFNFASDEEEREFV